MSEVVFHVCEEGIYKLHVIPSHSNLLQIVAAEHVIITPGFSKNICLKNYVNINEVTDSIDQLIIIYGEVLNNVYNKTRNQMLDLQLFDEAKEIGKLFQ